MGTREAPGLDSLKSIRARRLAWLPAQPEEAFGLPMIENHGGLRDTSVLSVAPW
jgi:hypothetical protein